MKLRLIFALVAMVVFLCPIFSQSTQTIKGTVVDQESKISLPGVNIILLGQEIPVGVTTDFNGQFIMENIPLGRVSLEVNYIGYESVQLNDLLLTAGKQLDLNIELSEAVYKLENIVVVANANGNEAFNEMATASSRSISIEETHRYVASIGDPARMVAAYGGVTNAGDDISNDISVRGNSPRGVLWRLEGIEVPNPNHFGSLGSSGGGISMLSASSMSTSDFYTGAFPAEFGNASSGVFDIKLRKGNSNTREHAFTLGLLGIEAATEGPFSKNSDASYLVNYRYSTFGLLSKFYNPLGDILPEYQDATFKIHLPTEKAGTFSIFGLGGMNVLAETAEADSTKWEFSGEGESFTEKQKVAIGGIAHFLPVGKNAYLKTVGVYSLNNYEDEYIRLLADQNYKEELFDYTTFDEQTVRISTSYNHKLSAKNTVRIGGIYGYNSYTYDYNFKFRDSTDFINLINGNGGAGMVQGYGQWKFRPHQNLTVLAGVHATYLSINASFALEPRAAVKWQLSKTQQLSAAIGMHSKPEHTSTYLVNHSNNPDTEPSYLNKSLDIPTAAHAVLGYSFQATPKLNITAEVYYQHLSKVPVASDSSLFSTINSAGIWDILGEEPLVSKGKGRNYGLDLTVQRSFNKNYYYLLSGSIYNSTYTPLNGKSYNTRYNGNYTMNLLGGKEFEFKKNDNIFGINGKAILAGGNRYTPIDLAASNAAGSTVRDPNRIMDARTGPYYRFDLGISYKMNRKRATHTIMFDVQNVTNRLNEYGRFYVPEANEEVVATQTGLFPFISYRVEFQTK